MLHHWDLTHAVAVTADGEVLIGSRVGESVSWTALPDLEGVQVEKVCAERGLLAILTSDGRVLVSFDPEGRLQDITANIHEILGKTTDIKHISICGHTIAIITADAVSLAKVDSKYEVEGRVIGRFGPDISLYSVDWSGGWGVVRSGNTLHWFGMSCVFHDFIKASSPQYWQTHALEFHDTASISEIAGNTFAMFVTLSDGRVYTRPVPWNERFMSCLFELITLPSKEPITIIVLASFSAVFITDAGNCYHSKTGSCRGDAVLTQIQSLCEYVVENIYELKHGCMIQHSSGRLCILHTRSSQNDGRPKRNPYDQRQYRQYMDTTKEPRHISFFDDKTVISVTSIFGCIYFITCDGVYWSCHFDEATEPVITRDTYFDANPLAVKRGTQSIRSALSALRISK